MILCGVNCVTCSSRVPIFRAKTDAGVQVFPPTVTVGWSGDCPVLAAGTAISVTIRQTRSRNLLFIRFSQFNLQVRRLYFLHPRLMDGLLVNRPPSRGADMPGRVVPSGTGPRGLRLLGLLLLLEDGVDHRV